MRKEVLRKTVEFLDTQLGTQYQIEDTLRARVAQLEGAIRKMLDSAVPHPVEHPTMTAAWESARATLTGSTTDWLDRQRREAVVKALRVLADDDDEFVMRLQSPRSAA